MPWSSKVASLRPLGVGDQDERIARHFQAFRHQRSTASCSPPAFAVNVYQSAVAGTVEPATDDGR